MPKMMRVLLAVMTVATGSIIWGLTAYAVPDSLGTVPEARGTTSAVIPVHGMEEAHGLQCFWYKGCKYCRSCASCSWYLMYCKKHHG